METRALAQLTDPADPLLELAAILVRTAFNIRMNPTATALDPAVAWM